MTSRNSSQQTIMLVEDDRPTAEMITFYLHQDGYRVTHVSDGLEALDKFDHISPSLCVLDIMLPGQDGIQLCRQIRERSNVPILMLSARLSDVDKTLAFGLGADDYVVKPFSPAELVSRVRAMLRRAYELNPSLQSAENHLLGGPRLRLDLKKHQVTFDGEICDLTPVEFRLLEVLMASPGWVYTRTQLLQRVWPAGDEAVEETVTVHISNLRKNLGAVAGQFIRTIRGVGYTYSEEN